MLVETLHRLWDVLRPVDDSSEDGFVNDFHHTVDNPTGGRLLYAVIV